MSSVHTKVIAATALGILLPGNVAAYPFAIHWHPGAAGCTAADARTEAHALDARTVVLRQNPCVDFEAPLVYLLIGDRRALLIDSGAAEGAAAAPLVELVRGYLERPDAAPLPLLVAHTHRHLDHRAGDAAFAALPGAQVVPIESAAARAYYGFADWPDGVARIDLGGRVIEVIPAPGHHEDHVVFYDARTRLLFTGDFLLPGRLIVGDLNAYRASAARLADYVKTHPVNHALGAHIELDARGEAYPSGATHHPNERNLALGAIDVASLPAALAGFKGFSSRGANYTIVNPIHYLVVFASGALAVMALVVWGVWRWRKRRRRTA
jgi:hydroxyacylglutathione hydrolase